MGKELKDMTNAELSEAIVELGLDVPTKATKVDLIAVIENFAKKTEAVAEPKEEIKEGHSSKTALLRADLFRKERIIVNDNRDTQTKEDVIPSSWGNRKTGGIQTDMVPMGIPVYVRRGAIANLESARIPVRVPNPKGGEMLEMKPRFSVVRTQGLTEEELAELAVKQSMRNSKYA